jgi:hypothetical protein
MSPSAISLAKGLTLEFLSYHRGARTERTVELARSEEEPATLMAAVRASANPPPTCAGAPWSQRPQDRSRSDAPNTR